jgi:4-amino-4-deoxy-L-arabinose transferase-like glycosyltransferase
VLSGQWSVVSGARGRVWLRRVALAAILLAAAALRLTGLDWDGFQHHHPDERYITWVATTIEMMSPGSAAAWRPDQSTFNPFHWPPEASSEGIVVLQGEPRDFAYGHAPLYLGVAATRLAERVAPLLLPLLPPHRSLTADVLNGAGRIEFHHLAAVGRALTALFDVGTVLLVYLLGRRLYSPAVGLLAAALLAVTVLHIQQAHFFTSDPYLTFFVAASLYAMVMAARGGEGAETQGSERAGERGRAVGWLVVAAAAVGLAVGSKFTAVLLVLPLVWTALNLGTQPASGPTGLRDRVRSGWVWVGPTLLIAVAVFALTNPFALLDRTCPLPAQAPRLGPLPLPEALARSCYLQNIATQNAMVRGRLDLGFVRQYAGTWPYLYFIEMQVRWGMGPLLGIVGFAGLGWAVWRALRGRERRASQPAILLLLLWVAPYFILTGSFYVKFMRYMQPIVPFLILFGAAMLLDGGGPSEGDAPRRGLRISRRGRWALAGLTLAFTALYAFSFMAIYREEHPWNRASRWIYEQIPAGTLLLSEQWDDSLPATMIIDGQRRRREEFPNAELTWLSLPDAADDEQKLMENLERLAGAEYVTILSNRVYGVVPRLPARYPLSSRYHQLLFDGALGYELVWAGGRSPGLFGVPLRPDTFGWPGLRPPAELNRLAGWPSFALTFGRADESFVVYDQPLTLIFRNTGRLSAEQMRAKWDAEVTP